MGNKLLILLLAFCFIAAVFAFGTDQHYDAWAHLNKIVGEVKDAPKLEDIATYWTQDGWYVENTDSFGGFQTIIIGGTVVNRPTQPPVGAELPNDYIYVEPEKVTDGNWGVFEPVQDFFGSIKGFFVRLFYTIRWMVDVLLFAFRMVGVIAPWNGYVKG